MTVTAGHNHELLHASCSTKCSVSVHVASFLRLQHCYVDSDCLYQGACSRSSTSMGKCHVWLPPCVLLMTRPSRMSSALSSESSAFRKRRVGEAEGPYCGKHCDNTAAKRSTLSHLYNDANSRYMPRKLYATCASSGKVDHTLPSPVKKLTS